jgi:hypothetical protein
MAIEKREGEVPSGGFEDQVFKTAAINWASAMLRGFRATFGPGTDHHIQDISAEIIVNVFNESADTTTVRILPTVSMNDSSGDTEVSASVQYTLLVDTV